MGKLIDRTGEKRMMKCGMMATIIEYRNHIDIDVKFEDGYIAKNKAYQSFKNGYIKNPNKITDERIGEKRTMNCGLKAEIIAYRKHDDIDIKFEDGYIKGGISYGNFIKGNVKRPLLPSVYGVGILDIKALDEKGDMLPSYKCWNHMLERCYDLKYKNKEPSYEKCVCSDEWKYFSNFKKWYDKNIYKLKNEKIALDKDILIKNNKIYSEKTCLLVPQSINNLFIKPEKKRTDLPIGVNYYPRYDKYISRIGINGKRVFLGYFETPIEAFYEYKIHKELSIRMVADEYKDKIPTKVYETMYNYRIEITD